ncbi:hypothetical protein Clacol_006783 [Clathrus columnatus]|uniref:Peptide hydrolase n=1 Tax=Clathrus columnatus TaxID=1419009 RepID=A0AAV5ADX1_9AGAM|nr:hypothetical protein Clacol_006783 [Clathrus columnatus]
MTRILGLTMVYWAHRILCLYLSLSLCIRFPSTFGYAQLSPSEVSALVSVRDPEASIDFRNSASHLSRILIPRPSGTENNTIVKNYIVSKLKALNWDVEEDLFTDMTPYGQKSFTNIIATKNPDALRRVILAAHFDSKFFATYPLNQFVGATDSAAPCAILLDVAETLNDLLEQQQEHLNSEAEYEDGDITLQLVFFDGEEALKDWTATDSLYGSRHLAEKWEFEYVNPNSHARRRLIPGHSKLSTIEHLILLDLLGSKRPRISSYFLTTGWLFDNIVSIEDRLRMSGAFSFQSSEDDIESFFVKRVGDLDDASALDLSTLKRWSLIFRIFTAEYLHLKPNVPNRRDPADLVRAFVFRQKAIN